MKHVVRDLGPPMDDESAVPDDPRLDFRWRGYRSIDIARVLFKVEMNGEPGQSGVGWSVERAANGDTVITLWDPRRGRRS